MHNRSLSNACITQVPGKSHFSPLVSPVVSNFNVCMNPRGLSATAPWFPSMNWDVMDLTAQDRPSSKKDEKLLYRWKKTSHFPRFSSKPRPGLQLFLKSKVRRDAHMQPQSFLITNKFPVPAGLLPPQTLLTPLWIHKKSCLQTAVNLCLLVSE